MTDAIEDLDASVRKADPDRWLASRFIADEAARADVIALYAFNHELVRALVSVREPLMAEIRLTWWSEAVAEIYDSKPVRRHPVALALTDVIRRHDLPREIVDEMIEARFRLTDHPAHSSVASETALMTLAMQVLGAANSEAATPAARVWLGEGATADANRLVTQVPAAAFPAVAYATLARHRAGSDVAKRVRLTWAVLRGRL